MTIPSGGLAVTWVEERMIGEGETTLGPLLTRWKRITSLATGPLMPVVVRPEVTPGAGQPVGIRSSPGCCVSCRRRVGLPSTDHTDEGGPR